MTPNPQLSTIPLVIGTRYHGDNLDILRRYLKDESVDLVHLDPPFNAARNHYILFQEEDGCAAALRLQVF